MAVQSAAGLSQLPAAHQLRGRVSGGGWEANGGFWGFRDYLNLMAGSEAGGEENEDGRGAAYRTEHEAKRKEVKVQIMPP